MTSSDLPAEPDPGPSRPLAGPFDPGVADPYRLWDAAYVLGSLSPAERREFEEHLAGCPDCHRAVSELAGLPGLLGQISPDEEAAPAAPAAAATEPEVSAAVAAPAEQLEPAGRAGKRDAVERPGRRRWAGALVALAATVVLVAGVVGVAALRGALPGQSVAGAAPIRLAFTPVAPTEILALVNVVPTADGTEFDVECIYTDEGGKQTEARQEYDIVVLDRQGRAMTVKTWTARPDHKMTPSGTAPLPVSKIDSVEIRPARSSQAVLRAELR